MRYSIFIISLLYGLTLLGCASPGRIPDSDFIWQDDIINSDYQVVYRNIVNGFRICELGRAEGNIYPDIKEGLFDVYLLGGFGMHNPAVLGRIWIKEDKPGYTLVRVGVQPKYDNPLFGHRGVYRKKWLQFASGDFNCD